MVTPPPHSQMLKTPAGDLIGFVYGGDVGVRYGGSGTDRVEKLGTPLRIGLGPDDPDQDRSVQSSVHA